MTNTKLKFDLSKIDSNFIEISKDYFASDEFQELKARMIQQGYVPPQVYCVEHTYVGGQWTCGVLEDELHYWGYAAHNMTDERIEFMFPDQTLEQAVIELETALDIHLTFVESKIIVESTEPFITAAIDDDDDDDDDFNMNCSVCGGCPVCGAYCTVQDCRCGDDVPADDPANNTDE